MKPPTFFYPALLSSLAFLDCAASRPDPRTTIDISARIRENHVFASIVVNVHGHRFKIQYDNRYSSLFLGVTAAARLLELERQANKIMRKHHYDPLTTWQKIDAASGKDGVVSPYHLEDFIRHPENYH